MSNLVKKMYPSTCWAGCGSPAEIQPPSVYKHPCWLADFDLAAVFPPLLLPCRSEAQSNASLHTASPPWVSDLYIHIFCVLGLWRYCSEWCHPIWKADPSCKSWPAKLDLCAPSRLKVRCLPTRAVVIMPVCRTRQEEQEMCLTMLNSGLVGDNLPWKWGNGWTNVQRPKNKNGFFLSM